jgi:hypothetical protein
MRQDFAQRRFSREIRSCDIFSALSLGLLVESSGAAIRCHNETLASDAKNRCRLPRVSRNILDILGGQYCSPHVAGICSERIVHTPGAQQTAGRVAASIHQFVELRWNALGMIPVSGEDLWSG